MYVSGDCLETMVPFTGLQKKAIKYSNPTGSPLTGSFSRPWRRLTSCKCAVKKRKNPRDSGRRKQTFPPPVEFSWAGDRDWAQAAAKTSSWFFRMH